MMKKLFLLLTLSVSCAAWAQPFREKMGLLDGLDPFWGWSLLGHFCEFEDTLEQDITIIHDTKSIIN